MSYRKFGIFYFTFPKVYVSCFSKMAKNKHKSTRRKLLYLFISVSLPWKVDNWYCHDNHQIQYKCFYPSKSTPVQKSILGGLRRFREKTSGAQEGSRKQSWPMPGFTQAIIQHERKKRKGCQEGIIIKACFLS